MLDSVKHTNVSKGTDRQKPALGGSAFVTGLQMLLRLTLSQRPHLEQQHISTGDKSCFCHTDGSLTHFRTLILLLLHWYLLLDHNLLEYFYLGTIGPFGPFSASLRAISLLLRT